MDEETKSAILGIINDGRELVSDHAPTIIHETLMWAKVQPILPMIACLITIWPLIYSVRKYREIDDCFDYRAFLYFTSSMLLGSSLVASFLFTAIAIHDAIHAWIAPNSYLINKFMQ